MENDEQAFPMVAVRGHVGHVEQRRNKGPMLEAESVGTVDSDDPGSIMQDGIVLRGHPDFRIEGNVNLNTEHTSYILTTGWVDTYTHAVFTSLEAAQRWAESHLDESEDLNWLIYEASTDPNGPVPHDEGCWWKRDETGHWTSSRA